MEFGEVPARRYNLGELPKIEQSSVPGSFMEAQVGARNARVLVIDDDGAVAAAHADLLVQLGYPSLFCTKPEEALDLLSNQPDIELILLDINMPGIDGLQLLQRIKSRFPSLGVIMATVLNDVERAVQAIKSGAYNYLLKPLTAERLRQVSDSFFSNRPFPPADPRFASLVTRCQKVQELLGRIQVYAEADVPILIEGETGTGKELVARIIHAISPRKSKRFLALNISAIPSTLFESELFGHARGAFTGAVQEHRGYLEDAGDGTLFLDEIGDLDEDKQKNLLRVLETRSYSRVGETVDRPVRARWLLATNRNLRHETQSGAFREDLYYRLASYTVRLPPLRERQGDIPLLADYFVKKYCSQFGRSIDGVHPEALRLLDRYSFPGNVRELEGIISAAVLMESGKAIQPSALPAHLIERPEAEEADDLETVRHHTIMRVLAECEGNQTRAAVKLGISRQTLNRLLREYREKR